MDNMHFKSSPLGRDWWQAKAPLFKKMAFGSFLAVAFGFVWVGIESSRELTRPAEAVIEFSGEEEIPAEQASVVSTPAQPEAKPHLNRVSDRIRPGETLFGALNRHSIGSQEANALANILKKEVNLRSIRAGDVFILERDLKKAPAAEGQAKGLAGLLADVSAFELVRHDTNGVPVRYRMKRSAEERGLESAFRLSKIETPVNMEVAGISGRLNSSLYDAIMQAGGDASLVNRFAEVFGSQIDFSSDPQRGDTFKIIVEKRTAGGRQIGFGRILAAEYNNSGTRYRGIYYKSKDGNFEGMFTEQGESLIKSFLKNPMQLTRISSSFTRRRFHPVLGRYRAHNGTDFAAPTGTPYWAVADGVVIATGYDGGRGKYVQVQHKNGVMTEYFHSSRLAAGIRPGSRVKMGQVIGYVGSTGLASGPHLHLGMKISGRYVDFARQKFTTGGPSIPRAHLAAYLRNVRPLLASLEGLGDTGAVRLSLKL